MGKLVAISPVGKNGQTVVPASIRRMFRITAGCTHVGFYIAGAHVEIAPIRFQKAKMDYSRTEIDKLDHLAKAKGGAKFKTAKAAKHYLKSL